MGTAQGSKESEKQHPRTTSSWCPDRPTARQRRAQPPASQKRRRCPPAPFPMPGVLGQCRSRGLCRGEVSAPRLLGRTQGAWKNNFKMPSMQEKKMFVCLFLPKMISTTRERDGKGSARSCPKATFSISFSGCWSFIESGLLPAVEPVSSSGGQTVGGRARWVGVEPSGTTQVSLAR